MKRTLFFVMGLFSITTFAQTGRVGINTEKPRATLDIVSKPITDADKNISRGVILPYVSDVEKADFTDKTEGLVIWNTTKKCIDFWNGTTWQCYGGNSENSTQSNITNFTETTIIETIKNIREIGYLVNGDGSYTYINLPFIEIPYTDGKGEYDEVSVTSPLDKTSEYTLTFHIPKGTFEKSGKLIGTMKLNVINTKIPIQSDKTVEFPFSIGGQNLKVVFNMQTARIIPK